MARRVLRPACVARRLAEIALIERHYVIPEPLGPSDGDHAVLGEGHNAYWPSPWRLLTHMLPPSEVDREDVFLDLGCGKGRVLLEAAEHYPFRRVIGVESEPQLAEFARALLGENRRRLKDTQWEVVTTDAVEYEIPDDVTVAYLFDPFTGPVFDAVISRLEQSVDRRPRSLRIVYLVPKELERLRSRRRIAPMASGTAGWWRSGGRMDYVLCELLPDRASGS